MNKNVLFIVEGKKDEPNFFKTVNAIIDGYKDYEFFVYNTNIHILIKSMFPNGSFDENIDLLEELKLKSTSNKEIETLSKTYTDIFMIFDLDPHAPEAELDSECLEKLLKHFNNSTDNGKLYINYPMMQSFRHTNIFLDENFKDKKVLKSDICNYKSIVNSEGANKYQNVKLYTEDIFYELAIMHIMKYNYIIKGEYSFPTVEEFVCLDDSMLFEKQYELLNCKKELYIINTCIFSFVEYNLSCFFKKANEYISEYKKTIKKL